MIGHVNVTNLCVFSSFSEITLREVLGSRPPRAFRNMERAEREQLYWALKAQTTAQRGQDLLREQALPVRFGPNRGQTEQPRRGRRARVLSSTERRERLAQGQSSMDADGGEVSKHRIRPDFLNMFVLIGTIIDTSVQSASMSAVLRALPASGCLPFRGLAASGCQSFFRGLAASGCQSFFRGLAASASLCFRGLAASVSSQSGLAASGCLSFFRGLAASASSQSGLAASGCLSFFRGLAASASSQSGLAASGCLSFFRGLAASGCLSFFRGLAASGCQSFRGLPASASSLSGLPATLSSSALLFPSVF